MFASAKQKVKAAGRAARARTETAQMGRIGRGAMGVISTLILVAVGALIVAEIDSALGSISFFDLSGTAQTVFNLFTVVLIVAVAGLVLTVLDSAMQ